jgi:hypothetical protein
VYRPIPPGMLAPMTGVKLVFWIYIALIAVGLVYFTVIGLTHH